MLFNSYEFIFFYLPVTLGLFYLFIWSGKVRGAIWWIGFASLAFYALGEIRFLPLLLVSILVNFAIGKRISGNPGAGTRRRWLVLGLVFNLGLLFYFKYTLFLLENLREIFGFTLPNPEIVLPVGISFFTFTQITFLVDSYRKKTHEYPFSDYLLFVTFFPHLVAGPLLIHRQIMPQLESRWFGRPGYRRLYMAAVFFGFGLFKKVIVADGLSPYVNELFGQAHLLSSLEAWAATLLYSFQLYFDFAGYSEMAVGLAMLMNVRIPVNFLSPYKATSIIDFWRRWHISLSFFLRDYLYIALGGNRRGQVRRYLNLLITMLLGGLWHGASWKFVIWGGLHGGYLIVNHFWRKLGIQIPKPFAWTLTFLGVIVAWVYFRAANVRDANLILKKMLIFEGGGQISHLRDPELVIVTLIGLTIWVARAPNVPDVAYRPKHRGLIAALAAIATVIAILNLGQISEFLYFQF